VFAVILAGAVSPRRAWSEVCCYIAGNVNQTTAGIGACTPEEAAFPPTSAAARVRIIQIAAGRIGDANSIATPGVQRDFGIVRLFEIAIIDKKLGTVSKERLLSNELAIPKSHSIALIQVKKLISLEGKIYVTEPEVGT